MKNRAFLFTLGLALGLTAGFFLGQEQYRASLRNGFLKVASKIDAALQRLIQQVGPHAGGTTNTGAPSGGSTNTASEKIPFDRAAYIRGFITILDVQARRDPGAENRASVSGHVKNAGSRRLQKVQVTVFFLGDPGIIHEAESNILGESPLEPGAEKSFSIIVANVPATWTEGKVRVAVIDVKPAE